jgi:hypothetical protein
MTASGSTFGRWMNYPPGAGSNSLAGASVLWGTQRFYDLYCAEKRQPVARYGRYEMRLRSPPKLLKNYPSIRYIR